MSREAAGYEEIAESGELASPASPAGVPSHASRHHPAAPAQSGSTGRPGSPAASAPACAPSNGATCSSMSYSGQGTPTLDQANAALSAQVNLSYNLLPARKSLCILCSKGVVVLVKASLQQTTSGMSLNAISHIYGCLQAAEPADLNSTGSAVPAALKGFTKEGTQAAASVATTVDERCSQAPASYSESAKQECAALFFPPHNVHCQAAQHPPDHLQSLDGLKQEVLLVSGCKRACTIVREICTTLRMSWCLQASVHRVRAADNPVEWEAAFAVCAAGDGCRQHYRGVPGQGAVPAPADVPWRCQKGGVMSKNQTASGRTDAAANLQHTT